MSSPAPELIGFCPHCGAEHADGATECWLCHAPLGDQPIVMAQLIAPPQPPASQLSEIFFASLSALVGLLVFLLGVGIFLEERALGVIYVILILPPLTVTWLRSVRKTRSGAGISWAERFITFLISSIVMFGILVMLGIAAIICLILICIANPPSFH